MAQPMAPIPPDAEAGPARICRVPGRSGSRAVLLAWACISLACGTATAQGRNQPAPPASRPTVYDPDPNTCQPDAIRRGFARQLEPYADQSEAVWMHLRKVQLQLTVASLKRCVAKGLMDEPTARALAAELLATQVPAPSTRP